VVYRERKHAEIKAKYKEVIDGREAIREFITDELEFQITTVW
jgi:hypothetical protein